MAQKNNFLIIFIFLFCGFFSGMKAAYAVNTGTIGLLPAYPDPNVKNSMSWFIYNLDLGKSREDALRVINNKEETAVIKLYAVDATVTSDGAFALLAENDPRKDVGSWVKLALNEVEIPPKSEKLIPFTISIPSNADTGDHAGGIVMQEVDNGNQNVNGTGVKIITRVGVRIYETVPGELKRSFSFIKLDWSLVKNESANWFKKLIGLDKKTLFFVGLKNEGNTKISPKIKVEIKNMFGRISGEVPESEIGVVFPRTETADSIVTWNGMPFIGRYTAKVTASFPENLNEGTKELEIWAFPYLLVVELVFIFIIINILWLIIQYFMEASKEKMPIYIAKEGDTLPALAEIFGIKWKKLVKYNELRKPYLIKPEQKLFIPINIEKYANYELLKKLYNKGSIEIPMNERDYAEKKSRKKLIMLTIMFAVAIVGCSIYYFKFRNPVKPASSGTPQEQNIPEKATETGDKTTSGIIKKSGIKVEICSPANADPQSNSRLQNKLHLIGYVSYISQNSCERSYENTTIEYKTGNKEQADIVKNDIGITGQVNLVEIQNLSGDMIVNNYANKNDFLQISDVSSEVSSTRELIKIKLLKAGASDENLSKIKDLINNGGYTIEGDFEESKTQSPGLVIKYQTNEQQKNAENLRDFLKEQGYSTTISETGNSSDLIFLLIGK
jgi:LysM repeat protein